MIIQADVPPRTVAEPLLPLREDSQDSGDPASEDPIEVIYRLHGKPLYRFLLRVTLGDRRQAEDLLQETLFRAWRYLQDHTAEVTRLRPWLYTVARRVAIDAARARQARPTEVILSDPSSLPAAHDDIERMLVALTIRRGLMSLTQAHRTVLIEVYYHDRTVAEAAAALGIPEGTVRSRVFYALRALGAVTGYAGATYCSRSASLVSSGAAPPKAYVS
jgi:RNA polymerase sigma-70 factor, ECF subfamily